MTHGIWFCYLVSDEWRFRYWSLWTCVGWSIVSGFLIAFGMAFALLFARRMVTDGWVVFCGILSLIALLTEWIEWNEHQLNHTSELFAP